MSEIKNYSIEYSNSYEKSLVSLVKDHYKLDKKARGDFKTLIDQVSTQLTENPRAVGDWEPWPSKTSRESWELRKARFPMPGLRGLCRHGRLIYLISLENDTVIPLIVYTHKECPTRPSDKELKAMIKGQTSRETDN